MTTARGVARQLAPTDQQLETAILDAILELNDLGVPLRPLLDLLENRRYSAILELLDLAAFTDQVEAAMRLSGTMFVEGAESTGLTLRLDRISRQAVTYAAQRSAELVTAVTETTRQAIREVVTSALIEGIGVDRQARIIRNLVGLTPRDAAQVARLAASLEDVDEAFARRRIDRLTKRLLTRRAEMIARTETLTAGNQGRLAGWKDAVASGELIGMPNIVWITTPDSRLCPLCAPMAGQIIQLGFQFRSDVEATAFEPTEDGRDIRVAATKPLKEPVVVDAPPRHIMCRCTTGIASVD